MLNFVRQFFEDLNHFDCNYYLYKGLEHLDEDLNGERGDIDLCVEEEHIETFLSVASKNGFYLARNHLKPPYRLYGVDVNTRKEVMLDVDTFLTVNINGKDSVLPHVLKSSFFDGTAVKVLTAWDYLLVNIMMLNNSNKKDVATKSKFLLDLHKNIDTAEQLPDEDLVTVFDLYKNSNKIWDSSLRELADDISLQLGSNISHDNCYKLKSRNRVYSLLYSAIKKYRYYFGRVMGESNARVLSKGLFICVIGVDGAGKSTIIEMLSKDPYLKKIGIKTIYMGSNKFWIPGLELLSTLLDNITFLNLFPRFLKSIDRQARLLRVFYYQLMGCVVICDRYFYDDEIDFNYRSSRVVGLRKVMFKLTSFFKPKVRFKPDLAIYLDVTAETAHSRKIEYSFEKMEQNILNYQNHLRSIRECTFIDANLTLENVYSKVYKTVADSIKEKI